MAAGANPLRGHARYEFVKALGSGAFGSVVCAYDKETDKHVAIKLLNRGNTITDYVETELLNHRLLWHPHIIRFLEVFLTNQHLCIVLEYAEQGDLFSFVVKHKCLPEKLARWLFQQHIIALDYLHRKNLCARDIKLENSLVAGKNAKDPLIKICDFGYSKHTEEQSIAHTQVGTPGYMAPEILTQGRPQNGQYGYDGRMADIWSSGVMLYTMLRGRYPFERPTDNKLTPIGKNQKVIERILACDVEYPETMSESAQDLVKKMLTLDPKSRITIAEIQYHPWFAHKLPEGVLRMNDPLLRHEIPKETLQQHAQELHQLILAAQKRLPFATAPIPYKPLATPQAQPPKTAVFPQEGGSGTRPNPPPVAGVVGNGVPGGPVGAPNGTTGQTDKQVHVPAAPKHEAGVATAPHAGGHGSMQPVTSFAAAYADQNRQPNAGAQGHLQRGTPAGHSVAGHYSEAHQGPPQGPPQGYHQGSQRHVAPAPPVYHPGGGYKSTYNPNQGMQHPVPKDKGFKATMKAAWAKLMHK